LRYIIHNEPPDAEPHVRWCGDWEALIYDLPITRLALFPFMRAPLTAGAMVRQARTTDDGGGGFLIHLLSKNQPVTLPDPAPCLQKQYIPQ